MIIQTSGSNLMC